MSQSMPTREPDHLLRCLACGQLLEMPLSLAGSLRCADCRDDNVPLDPKLADDWQQDGAQF
jgi:hypothetical protein